MKEWWLNLALREKQAVALGVLLLTLFCLYELLFASLSDATANLRNKIHKNQTLLTWMQDGDKRIQQLQSQHTHAVTTVSDSSSLLSRVQTELIQTSLQKSVSQLQQADNDSIEMHLTAVNFDSLTAWLIKLCRSQQLTITEMNVKPGATIGIVDATLKLKRE